MRIEQQITKCIEENKACAMMESPAEGRNKGQRYYLTGPEGMQKTTANNRTHKHTDGKIHIYTDMHVGMFLM